MSACDTSSCMPRMSQTIDELRFVSAAGEGLGECLLELRPWRSYATYEEMVFRKYADNKTR